MARPKEYNITEVLDAATELFWRKGYHGTSLSELVEVTKLNKQSMYQEFGNKAGLFKSCLEHYPTIMGKKVIGVLSREPLSVDNIRNLFEMQLEYIESDDFKGCLFINSANEKHHLDNDAVQQVEHFFCRLEKCFVKCLISQFSKSYSYTIASYLVTLFVGIMTVGNVQHDRKKHKKLLKIALSLLDSKG